MFYVLVFMILITPIVLLIGVIILMFFVEIGTAAYQGVLYRLRRKRR